MSVLNQEILSESEIEARFSDQWVLVEVLEWDATMKITRGIVRASGEDKEAIHEAAQELPMLSQPRKISIFHTGELPQGQDYLLSNDLFL